MATFHQHLKMYLSTSINQTKTPHVGHNNLFVQLLANTIQEHQCLASTHTHSQSKSLIDFTTPKVTPTYALFCTRVKHVLFPVWKTRKLVLLGCCQACVHGAASKTNTPLSMIFPTPNSQPASAHQLIQFICSSQLKRRQIICGPWSSSF
jgi:hypothetical protein